MRAPAPQDLRVIVASVVRDFQCDGWDRHELPMLVRSAATWLGVDLSREQREAILSAIWRQLPRPSV
jgi:DNA polymerase III delta subunit